MDKFIPAHNIIVKKDTLKQFNKYLGKNDYEKFLELSGLSKASIIKDLKNNKDMDFVKKINTCLIINEIGFKYSEAYFIKDKLPIDIDFIKNNGYSKDSNYLESFFFQSLEHKNVDLFNLLIESFDKEDFKEKLSFPNIIDYLSFQPTNKMVEFLNDIVDLNKEYKVDEMLFKQEDVLKESRWEDLFKKMFWSRQSLKDISKYESLTPLELIGNITKPIKNGFYNLYILGYKMDENKLNNEYKSIVNQFDVNYTKKVELEKDLNSLLNSTNEILKPINNNPSLSYSDKITQVSEKLKEYNKVLKQYEYKLNLAQDKELRLENIKEFNKEDITLER